MPHWYAFLVGVFVGFFAMAILVAEATAWTIEGGGLGRANVSRAAVLPPYQTLWETRVVAGHGGLLEHGVTLGAGRVYGATIDGTTFALDGRTGRVLWKRSLGRRLATTPTFHRGWLYVQAKRSAIGARLWKISARTGATRWNRRLGPSGSEGGPLVVRGKVFLTNGKAGRLRAYRLDGRLAWKRPICQAWQAPVWTGRYIVTGDYCGRVRAYNLRGKLAWQRKLRGAIYAAFNVVGNRLYAHTKAGLLYALNARNGRVAWLRRTGRGIGYPECAATRYRVFCANGWRDNKLSAWNRRGKLLWRARLRGQVMGAVVLTPGMLWVGTHDGVNGYNRRARAILGVNPRTGRIRVDLGSARYDPLAAGRTRLYVVHYAKIRAIKGR